MGQRKKGQALVEFALILPLLLAFILVIIDSAFLIQGYLTVSHATREAARWAITYQPRQGDCLHHDEEGDPINEPWPNCPLGGNPTNENETFEAYHFRRVQLIKREATDAALGLRRQFICNGTPADSSSIDSAECIQDHLDDPGMFGVQVWGYQSHSTPLEYDKPGIEGLPVVVRVEHNVPLVIFGEILPNAFIHVSSEVEMINEGVQVGQGNKPPPTGNPQTPTRSIGGEDTVTPEDSPTPEIATNTPIPVLQINLRHLETPLETAYNEIPEERAHVIEAHVYDTNGNNQVGRWVSFRTSAGSFAYSGTGDDYMQASTGSDGRVRATVYANEPLTATLYAWIDEDSDKSIDPVEEPYASVTKIWQAPDAPYLLVNNHAPEPEAWIAADVMDHPYADSPYSLWWCTITGTVTTEQLVSSVSVDQDTWDNADLPIQVPADAAGAYRIESHIGDGSPDPCGDDPVAVSGDIRVEEVLPDLQVSLSIDDDIPIALGIPITVNLYVTNTESAMVTGTPFDVDIYTDRESAPQIQQLGVEKQWVLSLGPSESTVLTETIVLYGYNDETHNLWAQVDTTNYVDEGETGGEDNNVFGPYEVMPIACVPIKSREDDFDDGGLGPQWTAVDIGNPAAGSQVENDGELTVSANGNDIWGEDDSFRYIYQAPISGDFRMDVHVTDASRFSHVWGKAGLMVRQSLDDESRNFTLIQSKSNGISRQYRPSSGASSDSIDNKKATNEDPEHYLRILRQDGLFSTYYSNDGESWLPVGPDSENIVSFTDPVYIGLATTSHRAGTVDSADYDDFEICSFPSASTPDDTTPPPGLEECTNLLQVTGFEGNPSTVATYWKAGGYDAYRRSGGEFHRGSFSMRLHASRGVYPCSANIYHPYLYQAVTLPSASYIFTHSTLIVDGYYLVAKSNLECSPEGPDGDDKLYLKMEDTNGVEIVGRTEITSGGAITDVWHNLAIDLSSNLDLRDYADQDVRIRWEGDHDEDLAGTYFFIDDVEAELCTYWPTPEPEEGTASFGGLVTALGEQNIFTILPGAHVWAYAQGGEPHQTQSIHDGSYRFYNMPPGTYYIYAEEWVGGTLRIASTTVTVEVGDDVDNLNLPLQ